ncbi:PBP1A family penicillin-binding protein [Candidatus Woesebacteria bacterium]|nr:PBP1A family penicillin-binding protein [Candidatus Woesebacteria bacterium]QQG47253.1 MAG: PBP1A family penicillin-binding protein [Candidatus Woesebacteria bacterium]
MWRDYLRRRKRSRYYSGAYSSTSSSYLPESTVRAKRIAKFAKFGFLLVFAVVLAILIAIPVLTVNLPSPDQVVRREGFSTKILDRNGAVLYDIFTNERRTPVSFSDIPEYLKKATVSIEDKNFYQHQGFDPKGILRAIYNIVRYHQLQSGSTLTQQLVKNVLLSSEQTVSRKVKELLLSIQIERKYSKDQILQMYLNEAPYGGTAWGVEAASETYFGKKVKDLNLVESAFLAGLPQRPSYYSPYSSAPKAYIDRTKAVLRRMREDGYITSDQEKSADDQLADLQFQPQGASFKAPHFVQYVQKILEDRYGENVVGQGGLKVTTTLDLSLQEKAQQIVADEISKVNDLHITNGAAVVIDPQTGEILAMVGSKDFAAKDYDGQVNVTTSLRQPGSSFKPFTYVTAFKKGYTPASMIMDVPTTFPGGADNPDYKPVNYDGKYRGPMQIRYALGNSINIVAVKTLALVGIKDVLETAYDAGVTTLPPTQDTLNRVGLSLTLGGGDVKLLELTDAYSIFLNGGSRVEPTSILKVEDSSGRVLENNTPTKGKRVITESEAFLIDDILSDNHARETVFGLNSLLNIPGRQIAVKTGTTNDKRDNWTIGGDTQRLVGVWVGNNDNSEMLQVASGVTGASPIWRRILIEGLKDKPVVSFKKPDDVITMDVDTVSGYKAHDGFPSRQEYFIKGTEPTSDDPIHVNLKICKNDGKLATPSDVAANNFDNREFFKFKEEDPTAAPGGKNQWQEGVLNWLNTQTDSKYHPPSDFCGTANPLNVEFINPTDRASNLSNNFTIKVKAQSISDIALLDLEIDGVKVRSFSSLPYEYNVNLANGVHSLRAIGHDANNNQSDRVITIGVNTNWDSVPSPAPSPIPTP